MGHLTFLAVAVLGCSPRITSPLLHIYYCQISVTTRLDVAGELLPVAAQTGEPFYHSQQAETKRSHSY